MTRPIILDLCGGSGAFSEPYKKAGYDVRLITLPEQDVRTFDPPQGVYGILAAPPCTEFSVARYDNGIWKKKKDRDFIGSMELVSACLGIIEKCQPVFWALENPQGLLSDFLGEPRLIFQPWFYGDPWTKKTAVWGKFNMPERQYFKWEDVPKIPELYTRPGRGKPSITFLHKSSKKFIPSFENFPAVNDAAFRAITPQGFSQAFFEANQ